MVIFHSYVKLAEGNQPFGNEMERANCQHDSEVIL